MEDWQHIKDMDGAKISDIKGLEQDSEEVLFITDKGSFRFYHNQDCCETVYLEDFNVMGTLKDSTIQELVTKTSDNSKPKYDESATHTFYTLRTDKGYLDLRFNGESNGYYSEIACFEKVEEDDD